MHPYETCFCYKTQIRPLPKVVTARSRTLKLKTLLK